VANQDAVKKDKQMNMPTMKVKKIFADAKLPVRSNPTDSGADVFVYRFEKLYRRDCEIDGETWVQNGTEVSLEPLDRVFIHTGLSATVGEGYEIQVRPRSGNALKRGLTVLNTPGTIDESYRGIIAVIIINLSNEVQKIQVGEKIAQLVVCPIILTPIIEVTDLDKTERNEKGFGSTGST